MSERPGQDPDEEPGGTELPEEQQPEGPEVPEIDPDTPEVPEVS